MASACAQRHACWREMRATRSRASACAAPWTRSCAAPASPRRTPATSAPTSCWRCSRAPAADLPLPLELVCARAAVIARNKAIDLGRRSARAPIAFGDDLPEPRPAGRAPGLARRRSRRGRGGRAPAARARRSRRARSSGLDATAAGRHRRARRRRCGARRGAAALDLLPRARACPGAPAQRPARAPRRVSARSATSPAARASCSRTPRPRTPPRPAATAAVAVGAALALSLPTGGDAPRVPEPVAIQSLGRPRASVAVARPPSRRARSGSA